MVRFVLALLVSGAGFAYGGEFENLEGRKVAIESCSMGPKPGATRLQNEKNIIVATWNVENVMESRGSYLLDGINPETLTYHYILARASNGPPEDWKFEAKQNKILTIGKEMGVPGSPLAHFIISPEIETLRAADHLFNSGELAGKYRSVLVDGNDERGIDVGFAIRADLDVVLEVETHKEAMWNDSAERQKLRLFSRDLPVVIVKDRASRKPLVILMGTHAKSKRDRPGDHESTKMRTAQHEASKLIIQAYERAYPATPILLGGDFNADVRTGPEVAAIRSFMKESLDVSGATERITETYHPPEGGVVPSQFDAIFMTSASTKYVTKAQVLPEYDRVTGRRLGVPKSFEDRQRNYPSDHRAVAVVFESALLSLKY